MRTKLDENLPAAEVTRLRRGDQMKKLMLTRDERIWLREYCKALGEQHPGAVRQLLIYGSKARGDAGPDSDLDVLLIVSNHAAKRKRQLRRIGYMLAAASSAVPSILAYTEDEWANRKQAASPFRRAVERDAVQVL
jgi:predicted nucleotidyltransferase